MGEGEAAQRGAGWEREGVDAWEGACCALLAERLEVACVEGSAVYGLA